MKKTIFDVRRPGHRVRVRGRDIEVTLYASHYADLATLVGKDGHLVCTLGRCGEEAMRAGMAAPDFETRCVDVAVKLMRRLLAPAVPA